MFLRVLKNQIELNNINNFCLVLRMNILLFFDRKLFRNLLKIEKCFVIKLMCMNLMEKCFCF